MKNTGYFLSLAGVYALGIENAVKWEIITGLCIIPPSKCILFI